jgi:DedD protein
LKQATKQRIVGTIVLLALGLIFLPIIFDGQGSYQPSVSSRIPPAPEVPILPEPQPTRPQLQIEETALLGESDSSPAAEVEQTVEEPLEESLQEAGEVAVVESESAFQREVPSLDENGLPQGWSVRLGTFANAANAENLLNRLLEAEYKAYSRVITANESTMTAVFVGPWLERGRVEQFQQELQDRFQLNGMIVRYEIESL